MLTLAVFGLSAFSILYVLIGYPLLVAAIARWRSRPIDKRLDAIVPSVSVILPVRNGEPWLRHKLESIARLHYPAEKIEVLVISDGSTDRTEEIAGNFRLRPVRVVPILPRGKAAALNEGMAAATGEILLFTDVRQELDPECLRHLIGCFNDPTVGAVSGELVIRDGHNREEMSTGLYWKYEKWIRKRLSRIDSVLGATGCLYAIRAESATPLAEDTLLDDVNLPLHAFFQGFRVVLDDCAKAYDYPTSLRTEFRRKVRTQAGVYQTIATFPALLGPGNRMWFHFLSHKLGRLLLPWALAAALAASFQLGEPLRTVAVAAQALFYFMALVDLWLPEKWGLKRLSSPVRTFVVLMAAALAAVSILVVPRRVLWKETRVTAETSSPPA